MSKQRIEEKKNLVIGINNELVAFTAPAQKRLKHSSVDKLLKEMMKSLENNNLYTTKETSKKLVQIIRDETKGIKCEYALVKTNVQNIESLMTDKCLGKIIRHDANDFDVKLITYLLQCIHYTLDFVVKDWETLSVFSTIGVDNSFLKNNFDSSIKQFVGDKDHSVKWWLGIFSQITKTLKAVRKQYNYKDNLAYTGLYYEVECIKMLVPMASKRYKYLCGLSKDMAKGKEVIKLVAGNNRYIKTKMDTAQKFKLFGNVISKFLKTGIKNMRVGGSSYMPILSIRNLTSNILYKDSGINKPKTMVALQELISIHSSKNWCAMYASQEALSDILLQHDVKKPLKEQALYGTTKDNIGLMYFAGIKQPLNSVIYKKAKYRFRIIKSVVELLRYPPKKSDWIKPYIKEMAFCILNKDDAKHAKSLSGLTNYMQFVLQQECQTPVIQEEVKENISKLRENCLQQDKKIEELNQQLKQGKVEVKADLQQAVLQKQKAEKQLDKINVDLDKRLESYREEKKVQTPKDDDNQNIKVLPKNIEVDEGDIFKAAAQCNLSMIRLGFENKLDFDAKDEFGNTAFLLSCSAKPVNAMNKSFTQFSSAVGENKENHKVYKALKEQHDSLQENLNIMQKTLQEALFKCYKPVMANITQIKNMNANVNPALQQLARQVNIIKAVVLRASGYSTTQFSVIDYFIKVVKTNKHVINNHGHNALHMAVKSNNVRLLKYLITAGITVSEVDKDGKALCELANTDSIRQYLASVSVKHYEKSKQYRKNKKTEAKYLNYLTQAACFGHTKAQVLLSNIYSGKELLIVKKQPAKQLFWLEKSALLGDIKNQYHLGEVYKKGTGSMVMHNTMSHNIERALYWFALTMSNKTQDSKYDVVKKKAKVSYTALQKQLQENDDYGMAEVSVTESVTQRSERKSSSHHNLQGTFFNNSSHRTIVAVRSLLDRAYPEQEMENNQEGRSYRNRVLGFFKKISGTVLTEKDKRILKYIKATITKVLEAKNEQEELQF
ncbi:MAG: hypothetical protein COB50_02545 [Thiotrichales bacterium]|nr:MAG: hypothetical protein COB50_02545 [Thiotrichales bacterium]